MATLQTPLQMRGEIDNNYERRYDSGKQSYPRKPESNIPSRLKDIWNNSVRIETPRASSKVDPALKLPENVRKRMRKAAEKLSSKENYSDFIINSKMDTTRRGEKRLRPNAWQLDPPEMEQPRSFKRGKLDSDTNVDHTSIEGFVPWYQSFPKHPEDGNSDQWFSKEFDHLYEDVLAFVQKFLCREDIDVSKVVTSPWAIGMPTHLLNYAQMATEPDLHSGGWDSLLYDKESRKWLLTGIIAKVLEAKVFDELLFGADEYQISMLECMDVVLAPNEGFERAKVRATTIRAALGGHNLTPHFYKAVAELAQQVFELLRPLSDKLRELSEDNPFRPFPPAKDILQQINFIVAEAAYLSVCVRLSSEIIFFSSETPGTPYDPRKHENVDLALFKRSKKNAESWMETQTTWLKKETRRAVEDGNEAGIEAIQKMASGVPPKGDYNALVQIVVWPSIKRFKPGNGMVGGEDKGFRIYDICKHRVLSFWAPSVGDRGKSLKKFVLDALGEKLRDEGNDTLTTAAQYTAGGVGLAAAIWLGALGMMYGGAGEVW